MNKIAFTKSFYDKHTIVKAIDAYNAIASITLTETDLDYICEIMNSEYDPQLVLNEFANYILGTMKA